MVVLSAWGGAGCEGPQGNRSLMRANVRFARTSENVIQIHKFFATEPWLRFRRDAELDGIKVNALYLVDGRTGKGAFGEGTIVVNLYRIDREPSGDDVATMVYEWSYDTEQAMPFRSTKRSMLGWGYQLRLHWGELELAGKQIELEILFERSDGRVVGSPTTRFRVPVLRSRRPTLTRRSSDRPARRIGATRPAATQPAFVPRADD